jgi:2-dehydropantoate 2-reductase
MHIAIFGAGGVGGYFGARLAAAGTKVSFIARGKHLAALRESGLLVESPMGSVELPRVDATDDPNGIGPVDVVFFTVKLYDSDGAIQSMGPLVGPETVVVPFQNGVESIERLSAALGPEHVAGGTTYVVAGIAAPGRIRHTGLGRLIFGSLAGTPSPVLTRLHAACVDAGIDAVLSENILIDIWTKFVRLTAFSGMTAVTRRPVGTLVDDPDLYAMLIAAVAEGITVARAKGIALPSTLLGQISGAIAAMPPESKSSMLEDLERGRPLELPWLSGAVVRFGEEFAVATPTHRFITTVLKPFVAGDRDVTREVARR